MEAALNTLACVLFVPGSVRCQGEFSSLVGARCGELNPTQRLTVARI
jgi:hypothetical protein